MSDDQRPSKRVKVSDNVEVKATKSKRRAWNIGTIAKTDGKTKSAQQTRTFSQPSVIATGDKGIFVSSDKGREKGALLELHDLLQQYLDDSNLDVDGQPKSSANAVSEDPNKAGSSDSIEASIAAELAELKEDANESESVRNSKPIQLITLDIPCVSFLRFPVGSKLDPCDLVHHLCLRASDPGAPQQGRYVKRLTPISSLAKVLSEGLDRISNECLPKVFGTDQQGAVESLKFAVRPTIRNNDKIDRDTIIHAVAKQVQDFGGNVHKVDLKNPDRVVLVDVYRGWIGMSVVDNTNGQRYEKGFEQLKRFNLAEIYSSRLKQVVVEEKQGIDLRTTSVEASKETDG